MANPTASNLHVFQECTGFGTIPETHEEIEAAQHGKGQHAIIESALDDIASGRQQVSTWDSRVSEILACMEQFEVPLKGRTEVSYVLDPGHNPEECGAKLGRNYPRAAYSAKAIFGSADYVTNGWLIDWKFTNAAIDSIYAQLPPEKSHQLKFLGSCHILANGLDKINLALVKIPDDKKPWLEFCSWDVMQAHEYISELSQRCMVEPSFSVGNHCNVCPRYRMCPTRTGLLRSAVDGAMEINKDNAPLIVRRLVDVRKALDMAEEQLEAYVNMTGERIDLGDGYFYGKSSGMRRDIVDPVKAVAMLVDVFGEEDAAKLLHTKPKMYIKELEATAKAHGKNMREVSAWLEKVGIIKRVEFDSIGLHRDARRKP